MDDARFDITGEIDGDGAPTDRQWKIAVQKLLIDRFQIQLHHEKREMQAFALVIAKGGPKLKPGDGKVKVHQHMGFGGAPGQTMYGNGDECLDWRFYRRIATHCDEQANCGRDRIDGCLRYAHF